MKNARAVNRPRPAGWRRCAHLQWAAVALAALSGGCGIFENLDVKNVATSIQKPANVAIYLRVKDNRQPLVDLDVSDFKVYENNQALDPAQSGETLLDPKLAAVHHALLLVDMSGPANPAERSQIARATAGFVERARRDQAVTVYAFDGSPQITLVGEYPQLASGADNLDDIAALESFRPADTSRNLNGAILAGLSQLDARLMEVKKPIRVGTLVVFTRGPDLAGRVPAEELRKALDETDDELFAVGVGQDRDNFRLQDIGRDGVSRAPAIDAVGIALESAADAVSAADHADYLLAYCSPARAGKRWLRVEVSVTGKKGDKKTGSVETQFDSTGLGPGCDAHAVPRFVMGDTPAEATTSGTEPTEPESGKAAPAP